MSSGLQHVAGASFFPTAKELSSGIQWFKDHPVLAAAAATAVSVITYLNATERGDEAGGVQGALPPLYAEDCGPRAEADDPAVRPALKSAVRSPLGDGSPLERRPSGEGKLSAAVSWCDEHGGSLTQVFEELGEPVDEEEEDDEEEEEEDEVDLDQPLRLFDRRRPPRRRSSVASTASSSSSSDDGEGTRTAMMKKSATAARLLDAQAPPSPAAGPTDELQTESPQWGWYVPITPPQDQFMTALPRAMAAVQPLGSHSAASLARQRPLSSVLVDSRRG